MQKTLLAILVISSGFFGFYGCRNINNTGNHSNATISVSILPQKYLIDRLLDSSIEVNVMVPPGSSPEMYEPSSVQMKKVANSVVYFAVGPLEFENSILPKIKELNPTIRFENLSKEINLIEGHNHHDIMSDDEHSRSFDPHVWTSPKEFKLMANQAFKVLCEIYPEREANLKLNLSAVNKDIDSLDSYIKKVISSAKTVNFIIYHPALSYFARDYGLNQIAIEEDGKNPSAQKMGNLIKSAKSEGLTSVFIQSQFDSRNAQIIAGELDGDVVTIDPLGYDWLKDMYDLTEKLSTALKSGINKDHE